MPGLSPSSRWQQLATLLLSCLLLIGCSRSDTGDKHHPERAAIHYISLLLDGKYEQYQQAMVSADSASDAYNKLMLTLHRQMLHEMQQQGREVCGVECHKAETTADGQAANCYLQLALSDSTRETMLLPLVWHNDQWRLR